MQIATVAEISATKITCDGYVPVDIRFEGSFVWPPYYWRTGDFERSLIEIGVDPQTGTICKVVVVCIGDLENEGSAGNKLTSEAVNGLPCANLAIWADERTRVDENMKVSTTLGKDRLRFLFGDTKKRLANTISCDRVAFLVDEQNKLSGFEIRELSSNELENFCLATGTAS